MHAQSMPAVKDHADGAQLDFDGFDLIGNQKRLAVKTVPETGAECAFHQIERPSVRIDIA